MIMHLDEGLGIDTAPMLIHSLCFHPMELCRCRASALQPIMVSGI